MSHSVADCQGVLIGEQEVIRRIGFEGLDKRREEERKGIRKGIRKGRTDGRTDN